MSRWSIPSPLFGPMVALLTLAVGGWSCTSKPEKPDDPPKTEVAPNGAGGETAQKGSEEGMSESAFAEALPGVDAEGLSPKQRGLLVDVARDVLCNCGRPTTLAGCMKDQPECKHGRDMMSLARWLVKQGATREEGADYVERYYEGFSPSRRASLEVDPRACHGPEDAPITLVEFADFECPYCGFAWPMVKDVVRAMNGRVRLCFLHFPLSQHEQAREAAQVTEAAKDSGKFFELADLFFDNQGALDRKSLLGYAGSLGLDKDAITKALTEGTYADTVEAQRLQGEKAGVDGTPSLFINGRKFILPLNGERLVKTIEDELVWKAQGGSFTPPAPEAPGPAAQ